MSDNKNPYITTFINSDGLVETRDSRYDETSEKQRERKSYGARLGHIKRRLRNGEPLKGALLEIALDIAFTKSNDENDLGNVISKKLEAGKKLSEYEHHIFVDVFLLHERLSH